MVQSYKPLICYDHTYVYLPIKASLTFDHVTFNYLGNFKKKKFCISIFLLYS